MQVNLKSFKQKAKKHEKSFKSFLSKIGRKPPKDLDKNAPAIDAEVWKEVDCLSCANCCKSMSPTFTATDIKRIAAHFSITPKEFKKNGSNTMPKTMIG